MQLRHMKHFLLWNNYPSNSLKPLWAASAVLRDASSTNHTKGWKEENNKQVHIHSHMFARTVRKQCFLEGILGTWNPLGEIEHVWAQLGLCSLLIVKKQKHAQLSVGLGQSESISSRPAPAYYCVGNGDQLCTNHVGYTTAEFWSLPKLWTKLWREVLTT